MRERHKKREPPISGALHLADFNRTLGADREPKNTGHNEPLEPPARDTAPLTQGRRPGEPHRTVAETTPHIQTAAQTLNRNTEKILTVY